MCYTTITHFNRCSHRTSTTTPCTRSIQYLPSVCYHPPSYTRPCVTDAPQSSSVFVRRDKLCDACLSVNLWFAGGGWPNDGARPSSPGAARREEEKKNRGASGWMEAGSPLHSHPHHHYPPPTQGRSARRQGGHRPAEALYPVPTRAAAQDSGGRCPLSEAFGRAVRIEGDLGGSVPAAWFREEHSGWVLGEEDMGEDEDAGIGHGLARGQEGQCGPFMPPRYSSGDGRHRSTGSPGGGLPSRLGGHGGCLRNTGRRTAGSKKKRVRFARKAELLVFRGDSATRTLGGLERGYTTSR